MRQFILRFIFVLFIFVLFAYQSPSLRELSGGLSPISAYLLAIDRSVHSSEGGALAIALICVLAFFLG